MSPNSQNDWRPSDADVERLARVMFEHCSYPHSADDEITTMEPHTLRYGGYYLVETRNRAPAWTALKWEAYHALVELHARPIGWKPEQDVTFTDDAPADDSEDTVPGTVDLSGLTQAAETLSRDDRWFRDSGLR